MAPIPDANFYDDAPSDGTGSKLIASDDDDYDVGNLPGEFAVHISGTTLIHLLELAEAHRATHGSWLDDGSSESELNLDWAPGQRRAQILMRFQISFLQLWRINVSHVIQTMLFLQGVTMT